MTSVTKWFKSGSPWIWLSGSTVTVSMLMVVGLLGLIAVRGLSYFWPADVYQFEYKDKNEKMVAVLGEIYGSEEVQKQALRDKGQSDVAPGDGTITQYLIKTGNRDLHGFDFRWLSGDRIQSRSEPEALMVLERREWGNFYGFLQQIKQDGAVMDVQGEALYADLKQRLQRTLDLFDEIRSIERDEIGAINYTMERLRLQQRGYELEKALTETRKEALAEARGKAEAEFAVLMKRLDVLHQDIERDSIILVDIEGTEKEIHLKDIVRFYMPNQLSVLGKLGVYGERLLEFLTDEPREANTEGGVFPAIFGTIMMVFLMSVIVTPFGVVAAVYLREYAKQGTITNIIRVSVINLAGVPSIVYGVFGLGFFIYILGGEIDTLFYPEAAPSPTFGTPGLIWASLTLALLTLPVVIVATEEGLARIPRSLREGSLALGATKAETIWRVIIPMSSPAIMTGLILAVARAAGEVAPLMLVGVVKLAPNLPLDGNFPFLHLERKFMHLGFHIYDVGFQSPNVEAARPLVYATAFLLVCVIVLLNISAISIRNRLREKYRALEN